MKDEIIPDKKPYLSLAFTRFSSKKHPINVKKQIFTAEHKGGLHNHDFPQLWYCLNGSYCHQVGDQVYECTKGSVVIIPAGVFHKFQIQAGRSVELFYLNVMYDIFLDTPFQRYLNTVTTLFLPCFTKELGHALPTYSMLSHESQTVFEGYLSQLSLICSGKLNTMTNRDIMEKLEVFFSLPEFALPEAYRQKAIQLVSNRLQPILQVLSYINNHYGEKIGEEQLLRKAGICHTNFYQLFKRYTSYTYSQYLQILRVKHVHLYLSNTTYPLSYISDVCGFCNTQYMSLVYKKYAGKSPRESRLYLHNFYKKN